MKIPEGFFIIYQPKYRVPCVFDLHSRGLFKNRPFVTEPFGFRILGDQWGQTRLQCAWLTETRTPDGKSGRAWEFAVEERLLALDNKLELVRGELEKNIGDEAFREKVTVGLTEWREGYLPREGETYTREYEKKIHASIADHKTRLRSELVHKNHDWIMAGLPKLLQDFRIYLYPEVRDILFETYRNFGGESDEARVVRHLALFLHIYDHDRTDLFKRHEWGGFQPEDQAWECWAGFTGSDEESKRLYQTMEEVFRPLAQEMTA